jgi:hypothetical protein
MICRFEAFGRIAATAYQGSRALNAQAEKVLPSLFLRTVVIENGSPSNLSFSRLDGSKPRRYWARQPPNLADLHAPAQRAYARIRARVQYREAFCFPRNLKIGWEGWEVGKPSIHAGSSRPTSYPTFFWLDKKCNGGRNGKG